MRHLALECSYIKQAALVSKKLLIFKQMNRIESIAIAMDMIIVKTSLMKCGILLLIVIIVLVSNRRAEIVMSWVEE